MPLFNNWDAVSPPASWTCDTCGQAIKHADHGWVEWQTFLGHGPELSPRDTKIRIVHHCEHSPRHKGCQYSQADLGEGICLSDASLREFMGPDGLKRLLEMLAEDKVGKVELLELLEIIKRIHIPRYEQARLHFR